MLNGIRCEQVYFEGARVSMSVLVYRVMCSRLWQAALSVFSRGQIQFLRWRFSGWEASSSWAILKFSSMIQRIFASSFNSQIKFRQWGSLDVALITCERCSSRINSIGFTSWSNCVLVYCNTNTAQHFCALINAFLSSPSLFLVSFQSM